MRRTLKTLGMALLVLVLTRPAAAQEGSMLRLLPTDDRKLQAGSEEWGALSASDYLAPDDSYVEAWAIEGTPGQSVTIDLISDDFDAYLYVAGPGLTETLADDDSGGGCHARLTLTFLESGTFHVVASSTVSRTTGTFALRVSGSPGPVPRYGCGEPDPTVLMELPTDGRVLSKGQPASGRLESGTSILSGRVVDAWQLDGVAGEAVTITMRSSDFDAYLFAYGPGMQSVASDDDSGGDLDAQLTLRFEESGRYVVGAGAVSEGAVGRYTLEMGPALSAFDLPASGALDVPVSQPGFLSDTDYMFEGRRSQVWTLDGTAGRQVTIELTSSDFDCYLMLLGPGITMPLEDDDSGGDLDSRLSVTLPASGEYRVVVSSIGGGSGSYTVAVR